MLVCVTSHITKDDRALHKSAGEFSLVYKIGKDLR